MGYANSSTIAKSYSTASVGGTVTDSYATNAVAVHYLAALAVGGFLIGAAA